MAESAKSKKVVDNHTTQTMVIIQVKHIAKPPKGKPFVAIKVQGQKTNITRSINQFLADLRESHLIGDDVTSMNDERVLDILRDLSGGSLEGSIDVYEAGSEYVVDENSSAYKNDGAKIGSVVTREKAGAHVEGFLYMKPDAMATQQNKLAAKMAAITARLMGVSVTPVKSTVATAVTDDGEIIETTV